MKVRVQLDTETDFKDFFKLMVSLPHPVYLNDGKRQQVCAQSQLGVLLARMEWDEIYCESEADISHLIRRWII
ncbi:MAG: hypothetical protein WDA00_06450 [Eubacteriales bacterium]